MPELSLTDARDFAEDLARRAAQVTGELMGKIGFERKSDDSPVTEADRRIQRMIQSAIIEKFPGHGFLGEETLDGDDQHDATGTSDYCWVVDPLDGTRNFTHSFPLYATAIALMHHDRPVVGVIHEHVSGWHCSAIAGSGVLCNGAPAQIARDSVSSDTLIAVPSGRDQPILPVMKTWLDCHVLRNVGSTAMHMAYLAAGAVDAVLCYECKLWDVAAGVLMISETGAVCTNLKGAPLSLPHPNNYNGEDFPFFAATPEAFHTLFSQLGM